MHPRSLVLSLSVLLAAAPAPAQEPALRLDLNIPALRLVVYEGDREIRSYPVAVGKPGHDTPDGRFTISHAEWNPWWRPPEREWAKNEKLTPPGPGNPMGRVKLFFMPLYFIHGTPERASIGTPASHGCVRMLNAHAVALARLLHERAAPQVSAAEVDRILARPRETRRVDFRREIELVIRYEPVVVEDGTVVVYPDVYRRGSIHSESIYQALLAAGYDVSGVDHADVRRLVERARKGKGTLRVPVREAFGASLAATLAAQPSGS